ncbi:MAG: SDR family NAD(P)-dependent oxidoreductase [Pseudomonadota bacterium]
MKRLQDRIALITGASRGIGRVIAQRFAEEGADLFICATNPGPMEKAAAELRNSGVKVAARPADVSDQQSVRDMVQAALSEFGRIDILVNNAGVAKVSRFIDYSLEDFDRTIKVNLYGVFHVTQAVLPGMMERKKGKIVNIASTAGKWGSRHQSAYNASKHAIVGLTRCIGLEMGPFNINVNAICPGLVETGMVESFYKDHSKAAGITEEALKNYILSQTPLQRLVQAKDVADLAVFLASEESNNMTCQSITVSGGYIMV